MDDTELVLGQNADTEPETGENAENEAQQDLDNAGYVDNADAPTPEPVVSDGEQSRSPLHIYYDPEQMEQMSQPAEPSPAADRTSDPEPPYVAPFVEPDLDPETGYRNSLPPPAEYQPMSTESLPPPPSSPPPFEETTEESRFSQVSVRESYMSDGVPAQEEELTVLHESGPTAVTVVTNQDAPAETTIRESVHTDHAAPNPARMTGVYDEVIPVDPVAVTTHEYQPIIENEIQMPDATPSAYASEPVVVVSDNNNANKDITWARPDGEQAMAGYSYASHEETIEMTDIVPTTNEANGGRLNGKAGLLPGDEPEFYFKAKSPINMNAYFICACIGCLLNVIFGGIALRFVQKGRDSETGKQAKKFGCIAIVLSLLGVLVTIGILLAIGFTRNPPWTV